MNLLEHAVQQAVAAKAGPVLVVLGAFSNLLTPYCSNAVVVENKDWQEGMASSIRTGVKALQEKFPGIAGCILSVCDQPYLNSGIFQQLIDQHHQSGRSIIASAYNDQTGGTPVYFDRSFFEELLLLSGDRGAKSLLQKNRSSLATIDFPQGKLDIDLAVDYEQMLGKS